MLGSQQIGTDSCMDSRNLERVEPSTISKKQLDRWVIYFRQNLNAMGILIFL